MYGSVTVILAIAALAAETKPAVEPVPTIPPALLAEYYRADGIVAHMAPVWNAANVDLQKAVQEVTKACGEKYAPSRTGDNHLVCAAKTPEKP